MGLTYACLHDEAPAALSFYADGRICGGNRVVCCVCITASIRGDATSAGERRAGTARALPILRRRQAAVDGDVVDHVHLAHAGAVWRVHRIREVRHAPHASHEAVQIGAAELTSIERRAGNRCK